MKVINAVGINDAMRQGFKYLLEQGVREDSRNGAVLVAPGPVATVYHNPLLRVAYSVTRNANPFFHLMEALWMLAGKNNIDWPVKFNKKFIEYSDDGVTQFGAYGWRWRDFFGYDQLDMIVNELKSNPTSRRCVLSMWNGRDIFKPDTFVIPSSAQSDLYVATNGGKDVPCNTHAYFDCRNGKLNMTVCNRSNDAVWGAYGANIVHFSMLQEYMASRIGISVGTYTQFSNNFHVYTDIYDEVKLQNIATESSMAATHYELGDIDVLFVPLMYGYDDHYSFEMDLEVLLSGGSVEGSTFVGQVAIPMRDAWYAYKAKASKEEVLEILNYGMPCDWKLAAAQWMNRAFAKTEGVQYELKI